VIKVFSRRQNGVSVNDLTNAGSTKDKPGTEQGMFWSKQLVSSLRANERTAGSAGKEFSHKKDFEDE
jgi:hypothetical protein